MTTGELLGVLGSAFLAVGAGVWKVLLLWASVRRQGFEAEKVAADRAIDAQREMAGRAHTDHQRMIEVLVDQAKSMTALGGELRTLTATLTTKLDMLAEFRERTPVEGHPRYDASDFPEERPPTQPGRLRAIRTGTNPHGYRPPKPGDRND